MRPWEAAFLGVLAVVYVPAVLALARVWREVDYYSHGFFVPVVALWAVAGLRPRLARAPRGRDVRGVVAIVAATLCYAWGMLSGSVFAVGIALVGSIAGAVLYLRGAAWLRVLAFPVAFLLFMVPAPSAWITPVIVKLQFFVSTVAVGLLRFGGLAVQQSGNVIRLPTGDSLFVAEACSGITSIITLVPLAVFLAYFTERALVRRLVLVAAAIPLAMLCNLVRVVVTVVAARFVGTDTVTTGPLHEWSGVAVYAVACIALLAIGASMRRWLPPATKSDARAA